MTILTPAQVLAELVSASQSSPPEEVRAVLADIWPRLHAPLRHYGTPALVALFRRAGYLTENAPMPGTGLVIYRGEPAYVSSPGIAWSADHAVAADYARRYSTAGPTRVLRATAPPSAVLARFAHNDDEVVVQPDLLKDVGNIASLPHFTLPNLAPVLRSTACR
jgi:transposase InsO family protein